jgi:hypothetical protein
MSLLSIIIKTKKDKKIQKSFYFRNIKRKII